MDNVRLQIACKGQSKRSRDPTCQGYAPEILWHHTIAGGPLRVRIPGIDGGDDVLLTTRQTVWHCVCSTLFKTVAVSVLVLERSIPAQPVLCDPNPVEFGMDISARIISQIRL